MDFQGLVSQANRREVVYFPTPCYPDATCTHRLKSICVQCNTQKLKQDYDSDPISCNGRRRMPSQFSQMHEDKLSECNTQAEQILMIGTRRRNNTPSCIHLVACSKEAKCGNRGHAAKSARIPLPSLCSARNCYYSCRAFAISSTRNSFQLLYAHR